MTPRIGIRLPQYGTSWDDIRDTATLLDGTSVDALWVNDHFQSPGRHKADATFDAITTLAAIAACTTRVRLGTAVLSASYRPAQVAAKQLAVIDAISGGRTVVGLGAGSDRDEHRAFGVRYGTPAERTAAVRTTLATWEAMWSAPDGASVPGVIDGAPVRPLLRRPPVWIAAHGPVLLREAGRRADGVIAAWTSPHEFAGRIAVAADAAAEAGRPAPAAALYMFCLIAASAADRADLVAAQAARLGTSPARFLRWLGTTGLVGSAEDVRDRLADYAAAGVTDVILALPERVPIEAFAAIAAAFAPAVAPPAVPAGVGVSRRANLVQLLVGQHRKSGRGDRIAAIDPAGCWTYDELWAAAAAAGGALSAEGVRAGERVAIALRDSRPWLAAFLGAAWIGAVAIPVDPLGTHDHTALILDDCAPRLTVVEPDLATGGWPAITADALAVAGPAPPVAAVHPDDLAYMIYSSGSTGRPKGVMHAHRDLAAGVETYARHILELGPGNICHSTAKLFTSLGFGNGFFRVLGSGATCLLNPHRTNPRTVVELVAAADIDVLTGVPTFWAQLVEYLHRHPNPSALAGLRLCVSSGDGLPPGVAAEFADVAPVTLIEGLGCSECSNIVISTRPGDHHPGSIGSAVPGVEISLRDPDGREVPDGSPGRLWIRSPSNTSGYWRRADETRELVVGEWIRMGDVLVSENGRFRHVGRVDDLFKVHAQWVSPTEVESCLLEDSRVREAAVGGVPDEHGMLRVVAWITVDGAPTAGLGAELRRHVAHRLAPYKAPRQVIVREALPRLPSGKLNRRLLREQAGAPA